MILKYTICLNLIIKTNLDPSDILNFFFENSKKMIKKQNP